MLPLNSINTSKSMYWAILDLIEFSKEQQLTKNSCKDDSHIIILKGPRRCGHTSTLLAFAKNYFDHSVFITSNESSKDYVEKQYSNLSKSNKCVFFNAFYFQVCRNYLFSHGSEINAVLIDNYSVIYDPVKKDIMQNCDIYLSRNPHFIICLG